MIVNYADGITETRNVGAVLSGQVQSVTLSAYDVHIAFEYPDKFKEWLMEQVFTRFVPSEPEDEVYGATAGR